MDLVTFLLTIGRGRFDRPMGASYRRSLPALRLLAEWIRAVVLAESAGRTTLDEHPITSPSGAMGLMQVMPYTYENLRQALGLGGDPYDPHDNIIARTAYLAAMHKRVGYPGLFTAYYAGPECYDAWLQPGTPLPTETRAYLRAINSDVAESGLTMGAATGPGGSGSRRVASSRPRIEPKFQSGRSLFSCSATGLLPLSNRRIRPLKARLRMPMSTRFS
jgi:Transglycosylase SLT domain